VCDHGVDDFDIGVSDSLVLNGCVDEIHVVGLSVWSQVKSVVVEAVARARVVESGPVEQ
jgi:hypothetical protein